MSLLKDYLEKTTPVEAPDKDIQIPPMLRKDNKKDSARFRRLTILVVIFIITLCFTGYMFRTSVQDLMNQKKTVQVETVQIKTKPKPAHKPEPASTPAPAVNKVAQQTPQIQEPGPVSNMEQKQKAAEKPVQEQINEQLQVQEQVDKPLGDQVEQIYPVDIEQKIQAAMEGKNPEELSPLSTQTNKDINTEKPTQPQPTAKPRSEAGPEDYFNLGVAAQKTGDIRRAVSFYRKALILEPDHSKTLLNLSAIHMKTGNNDRAMNILKKLHDREPENVDAMVNLSILFTGEKNYDKAESILRNAMMLQGHNTTVLFNLAYVNQLQNRLDQARELYSRVSSIDRNNTKAFLAAASILERQKKILPALECYAQALNTAEVKASEPFRLKIENRIGLLRQIQANAGSQTLNSEDTHD